MRSSTVSAATSERTGRSRRSRPKYRESVARFETYGFPAAGRAAPAARTVDIQGDVAEFTGDVVLSAHDLAALHDADAQAVRHGDVDEVAGRLGVAGRPELRQRAGLAGVFDLDRHAERGRDRIAQTEVAPAQVGREEHQAGFRFDHARHDDADALAAAEILVLGEEPLDALHETGDKPLRIALGREAGDAGELAADQVGHHDERARRPDVDRHHAALARIDVEKGRLAAALRLAGGPFEDGAVADQLVDEQADRAAAGPHQPRQVGARNRLMGADQVQRDPAVDLPGGGAGGDAEVLRVDGVAFVFIRGLM